ncbi:MAG: hypothetical protein GY778_24080 [bacterium]|nr:hypothetical protein [bacterium]
MMSRSFGIVDGKVAEASFFLESFAEAGTNFFKRRCYFSAFVASARSITYAMQAAMKELPGFDEWYAEQQAALRSDGIARFFHEARRLDHHVGVNLVAGGSMTCEADGIQRITHHFASDSTKAPVPQMDVYEACVHYFKALVALVFACYCRFGESIDPHDYYTAEAFGRRGLSIEDAEEEVFGWRGWTDAPGVPVAERWRMIRRSVVGCNINHLFERFLGKVLPTARQKGGGT